MTKLTDEQVAEWLRLAEEIDSDRYACTPEESDLAVLALALHERLQAAEAERDCGIVNLIDEVNRIKTERDEARQALPTDQQRKTLAYWIWPEAPGGWDDLAAAAKRLRESHDALARDIATARQQARREAFEEVDERVRLLPVPASSIGYRDAVMLTIRALSEVER
jgi:hypothetical protein